MVRDKVIRDDVDWDLVARDEVVPHDSGVQPVPKGRQAVAGGERSEPPVRRAIT